MPLCASGRPVNSNIKGNECECPIKQSFCRRFGAYQRLGCAESSGVITPQAQLVVVSVTADD